MSLPPTGPIKGNQAPPATAEMTSTVVIGSGLSGLAVASELSRRGIESIVVEGIDCVDTGPGRTVMADSAAFVERTELLRLLRGYAQSHALDIRHSTVAENLCMVGHSKLLPAHVPGTIKWAVQTGNGVLLADHVVLTKYPQNQLRRFLHSLGIAIGRDLKSTLREIGLYLVGIGETFSPTMREMVRQAKVVSDTIVAAGIASRVSGSATATPAISA